MNTAGKSPVATDVRVQRRRRPAGAALLAIIATGVVALAGCSAGADPQVDTLAKAQPQPSANAAASPTPSSSPSIAPQNASGDRAVLAANDALSSSLFSLVNASNRAKTDNNVRTQRKGMAAALTSARTALAAERKSAYGGLRSCPRVDGNLSAVRSAAGRVAGYRVQLLAQTAKVRGDLSRMSTARAVVVKRLSAMESAAKAASDSSQGPVIGQVKAALAQETRDQAAILASVHAAEQKAASTLSTAYGIRANAESIAVKAC